MIKNWERLTFDIQKKHFHVKPGTVYFSIFIFDSSDGNCTEIQLRKKKSNQLLEIFIRIISEISVFDLLCLLICYFFPICLPTKFQIACISNACSYSYWKYLFRKNFSKFIFPFKKFQLSNHRLKQHCINQRTKQMKKIANQYYSTKRVNTSISIEKIKWLA